jgi:hypothetical protein
MDNKITVITTGTSYRDSVLSDKKTFLEAEATVPSDFEVDSRRVSKEILKLMKTMDALETNDSTKYEVDQIEFNLGVNANGKVGIFCANASIGAAISIKVTIKKKQ